MIFVIFIILLKTPRDPRPHLLEISFARREILPPGTKTVKIGPRTAQNWRKSRILWQPARLRATLFCTRAMPNPVRVFVIHFNKRPRATYTDFCASPTTARPFWACTYLLLNIFFLYPKGLLAVGRGGSRGVARGLYLKLWMTKTISDSGT